MVRYALPTICFVAILIKFGAITQRQYLGRIIHTQICLPYKLKQSISDREKLMSVAVRQGLAA